MNSYRVAAQRNGLSQATAMCDLLSVLYPPVALELSGWDVDVTLQQMHAFPDDAFGENDGAFWAEMTEKRWAFLRDEGTLYAQIPPERLPKSFTLHAFDNDTYRSLAGFAREHGLIKRGKSLEEKTFFEFHWAHFFRCFAGDSGPGEDTRAVAGAGLWGEALHISRAFQALMATVISTPNSEYSGTLGKMIAFSRDVSRPLFVLLVRHLEPLCQAYASIDVDTQAKLLRHVDYQEVFGRRTLPVWSWEREEPAISREILERGLVLTRNPRQRVRCPRDCIKSEGKSLHCSAPYLMGKVKTKRMGK